MNTSKDMEIQPEHFGCGTGLADTHLHLHFPQYDADRAEIIRRAIEGGVRHFLNIGTDLEDSKKAIAIAEEYPEVYAAVGYHPHETKHARDAELAGLEKLLSHPKVVAIGEVGLDYFHEHSPREVQQKLLRTFLSWYDQHRKPIIIHCRDAYAELLTVLQEHGKAPYRGVLHCYSSDAKTMKKFLDLGFHIAFGGALTYKKNDPLREACAVCPKDRLLLETDAPYLAPQSKRGQRNEPLFMIETAEYTAKLHKMDLAEIAHLTTENAKGLFGLC
ncbi:MAG TPA: TatD family hydrolase [Candidatus Omnitrophota bacterium]|nr:TatD family hydrolase [Candidatus Omnitrophota bacterium]HRY85898.1 TatD family hydrolase [Candidatus Omnitrophota bacterium]